MHIAKQGFAVYGGLKAHIPDINPVVNDCITFFNSFFDGHVPPELPSFLYVKSLGGAIALLITLRRSNSTPKQCFDDVVLNEAMCSISDKFKPPWPLEHFLDIAVYLIPTWHTKKVDQRFKDPVETPKIKVEETQEENQSSPPDFNLSIFLELYL
nr:caffeoylshikimate esterase-like [Ipomoea trifida]GMD03502.1 caffeoylshikimate esterase-like [Ipomoea batatas]